MTGEDAELVAEARAWVRDYGRNPNLARGLVESLATHLAALSAELEGARSGVAALVQLRTEAEAEAAWQNGLSPDQHFAMQNRWWKARNDYLTACAEFVEALAGDHQPSKHAYPVFTHDHKGLTP